MGTKGEVACYDWLSHILDRRHLRGNFREFLKPWLPDISYLRKFNFEVKSVNTRFWTELGRMLPPHQRDKYAERDVIIIWTSSNEKQDDDNVTLHGWNFAKEFLDESKVENVVTICPNIKLKNFNDVRDMATLEQFLRAPVPPGAAADQKQ